MTLKEQIAFLKGLEEGLGLDTEAKEVKLMSAIVDTLVIMADEIEEVVENALDIGDELDALSEDLSDVEQFVFDDDDDDNDDVCGKGCYCNLCSDTGDIDVAADDISDSKDIDEPVEAVDAGITYDITCPNCNAEIELDEEDLAANGINCPKCNEHLEFEFEVEDDDEDAKPKDVKPEENKDQPAT
jgi:predicted Zn finger-like uncharacterized protein